MSKRLAHFTNTKQMTYYMKSNRRVEFKMEKRTQANKTQN